MSSLKHMLEISAAHKEAFEAGKQAATKQIFEELEKLLIYNVDWIASISYGTFEDLKEKHGVK